LLVVVAVFFFFYFLAAKLEPERTSRLPSFADDGQNNLGQQLLGLELDADAVAAAVAKEDSDLPTMKEQIYYTFLVALPPFGVAVAAHDVQIVRTLTGSFPGLAVMFFIPSCLVYLARKALLLRVTQAANTASDLLSPSFRRDVGSGTAVDNPQMSPFKSNMWIYVIVLIAIAAGIYDAVDLVIN